jgi:hypothetical protein
MYIGLMRGEQDAMRAARDRRVIREQEILREIYFEMCYACTVIQGGGLPIRNLDRINELRLDYEAVANGAPLSS